MILAIYWDGVCTDEPKGFASFINSMRMLGHKVYIVTMRYPSECLGDKEMCKWAHGVDGVIATKRKAKRVIVETLGLKIQVWIDDHPKAIDFNAEDIWDNPTPEGDVHTIDHATGEKTVIKLSTDVDEEYQREMQSKLMFVEDPVVPVAKKAPSKIDGVVGFNNTNDITKVGTGLYENVLLGVFGTTTSSDRFAEIKTREEIYAMNNLPVLRVVDDYYKATILARVCNIRQEIFENKQLIYGDLELATINATWPEIDLLLFYNALDKPDNNIKFSGMHRQHKDGSISPVAFWGVVFEDSQVAPTAIECGLDCNSATNTL